MSVVKLVFELRREEICLRKKGAEDLYSMVHFLDEVQKKLEFNEIVLDEVKELKSKFVLSFNMGSFYINKDVKK